MSNILEVREFDTITCNRDYENSPYFRYLDEKHFKELEQFIREYTSDDEHSDALEFMKVGYRRNVGNTITFNNNVGIIELPSGYQIEILPKVSFDDEDKSNSKTKRIFLNMLCCLKEFEGKAFGDAALNADRMNLYEIFINMYLKGTQNLVKHGIKSSYIQKEENLAFFKGKLSISQHIKTNLSHKERFYMQYDEYQVNRAENRLVKAVLLKLQNLTGSVENGKEIRQLLTYFEFVDASINYEKDFSLVSIGRDTKDYELLIQWAKVFLYNKSFAVNEALAEVFKIYSAVADADDAISLYGALTGRLFGLSKDEILTYKINGGKISLKSEFDSENCEDKTACFVASKMDELKNLYYIAQRLSPAALFSKIMDDFKVYEIAEAEKLEVVYYTLELLRNAEKSGIVVSLKDGVGYISELIGGVSGEERCLSLNDGRDAVHMANLHKVKGLEAPVIILSAAVQFNNSNDKRIEHGDDGSEGYIFGLPKKDDSGVSKGNYFETKNFSDKLTAEKASGLAENQRLIYVAATRARNVLIICDSIQAGRNGEIHKSVWKPIMEGEVQDFFTVTGDNSAKVHVKDKAVDSKTLYDEAEKDCVLNDRSMENATYSVEIPSRMHISSKLSEEQEVSVVEESVEESSVTTEDNTSKQNAIVHKFPALLGTMTHKLMEMLVSTKNSVNVVSAINEIIREYRTPTFEKYEKDLTKALTDVAENIRNGGYAQTNGLPQDILKTLLEADQVYCEVPFCYSEDGESGKVVWNGIMDVVYCSKGKWHIVDYKTNDDGSDLDRKYQAQLSAYVKAFKTTTGEDADALTYHIDI